jgi:D-proline reductase (dithiol) PrdB
LFSCAAPPHLTTHSPDVLILYNVLPVVRRFSELSEAEVHYFRDLTCPTFEHTPLVDGPPLDQRRVAISSTAGLYRHGDRPFTAGDGSYRVIDGATSPIDLVMGQLSINFDRTGFQQDPNIVFPIDRLRDLVEAGAVGQVAALHYSFMRAIDPSAAEPYARELVGMLRDDNVDGVLFVPV